MIVTHIDKNGYLRFGNLGWLSPQDIRRHSVVFQNGVRGVITLPENKEEAKELKLSDLVIDIGAENEVQAGELVQVGDVAVLSTIAFTQNGKVFSRYLDNRSGCAVLLKALEQISQPKNDLYFVFSVQEEVGLRGAKPAAFRIDPDGGIAVDVTGSDDLPGAEHTCSSVLGKGPAIKLMDSSVICQPEMVQWMMAVAERENIPVQRDILTAGGTDAGVIQPSRCGVWTGGISIPCRCTHAPVEVCDLKDLENCARLIAALAERAFFQV